ncbi:MAG TPA: hypothetical protein VFA20_12250 [Myxococcaceae bacterium]|nr:hypothetical protein [Myxococcaceae bacterium]
MGTAALVVVALSLAQAPIGKAELALAREKLERSKKDFSKEQWLLLNGKLSEAEAALAELAAVGGESAVVAAGGTATVWAALETLPLFLLLLPATAHAPGLKESPARNAARTKYEDKLRELAQAAQLIESQQAKMPPDDDEDCSPIGEGGGKSERFCKYQCGDQRICVRVPRPQRCPYGSKKTWSRIEFGKLARLPRCPPNQNPD